MAGPDELARTAELRAGKALWRSEKRLRGGFEDLLSPRPKQGPHRQALPSSPPQHLSEASARFLLAEAEALFAARRDQVIRAEARATTLQASAGVAIGLALTGAAFLVDPTKVADRPWRIALTVVFVALLGCLAMAGYLANRATAKILTYYGPRISDIVSRAEMPVAEACWSRAVALLRYYEWNRYFSNFKIQQVKVAGLWFRAALVCFALLSLLLAAYTMVGSLPYSAQ
jgi:hypothetical protein